MDEEDDNNNVNSNASAAAAVKAWYDTIWPRTIDIVVDYGAKDLFLIHGESLILHCLTEGRVDFYEGSFQLLHAVFEVEKFLSKLLSRGCYFHIAFFENPRCAYQPPPSHHAAARPTGSAAAMKYDLARLILIRHLEWVAARDESMPRVHCFASHSDPRFSRFLDEYSVRFMLCHDGKWPTTTTTAANRRVENSDGENDDVSQEQQAQQEEEQQSALQSMIYALLCRDCGVALIHGIEFKSSRIFLPIFAAVETVESMPPQIVSIPRAIPKSISPGLDMTKILNSPGSLRRTLILAVSDYNMAENGHKYETEIVALLLHLLIIERASLSERVIDASGLDKIQTSRHELERFLSCLWRPLKMAIEGCDTSQPRGAYEWDLYDFVDGTLLLSVHCRLKNGEPFPESLAEGYHYLRSQLKLSLSNAGLPKFSSYEKLSPSSDPQTGAELSVMPFRHPVLDEFLNLIKVSVREDASSYHPSQVFEELTHWHNSNNSLESREYLVRKERWRLRSEQRLMADTLTYAASLTNPSGGIVEPEIIVLDRKKSSGKKGKAPKGGNMSKGAELARAEASKLGARKQGNKEDAVSSYWSEQLKSMRNQDDLKKRYWETVRLIRSNSSESAGITHTEMSLYLCDILYLCCKKQRLFEGGLGLDKEDIAALLWRQVLDTCKKSPRSVQVLQALRDFAKTLSLPEPIRTGSSPSRELSFTPFVQIDPNRATPIVPPSACSRFQLQRCGPYLDRAFDSQPDERVPFNPDAWQRTVLDGIDANKSLFVVAPTSSGKTFISYYAMKKVLMEDDDGVLVYIAPTKALVNQIAAEVQARFSKKYPEGTGRTVWAIHTRDYRINNPSNCQVLVTVPHILQIMLLSPVHSKTGSQHDSKKPSWTQRIKRIIFDEVHCIGQADEGAVWEQLLLMAPCPIIALSATVGNTDEFYQWLKSAQAIKGIDLQMVQHHHRYSDLRHFLHRPFKHEYEYSFKGLDHFKELPIPGVDKYADSRDSFVHMHPIAAIGHRGVKLSEIGLEPKDAELLWSCMDKCQTSAFPLDPQLHPDRVFSGVLTKSHVVSWVEKLKEVLAVWLREISSSPFRDLRAMLLDVVGHGSPTKGPNDSSEKGLVEKTPAFLPIFRLAVDLQRAGGLPAIFFNYDRVECERALETIYNTLEQAEAEWKNTDAKWKRKVANYEQRRQAGTSKMKTAKKTKSTKKQDNGQSEERFSKDQMAHEEADNDFDTQQSFDANQVLEAFSFADYSKTTPSEVNGIVRSLRWTQHREVILNALRRGIGVHHAGMNRKYRQQVEMLFRKGFLTVVIATGTLALGINMPCKTVAFTGDSAFLTTLNYRQGSGRAGRRGFDLLGNVVFSGVPPQRACELMTAQLPDLKGHFPLSTTLLLRCLGLLHATKNSPHAADMVRSLLSQNQLYLGGPESKHAQIHHMRFSLEYLRRQELLSADGKPLNFAGLISHLYFTENSVFAFHSLLKAGYFHRLCANVSWHEDREKDRVLRELMLIMSHLFSRVRTRDRLSTASAEGQLDPSRNHLLLPRLPTEVEDLLIRHNNETLKTFQAYVSTFIDQHLSSQPDNTLPLSGMSIVSNGPPLGLPFSHESPPKLRSPFMALSRSGRNDEFESIADLCSSVRSGVFLEQSAVPYLPIWPRDTEVPLNGYLYNFFKEGSYAALVRDNRIKQGDVWFLLKDFSLILAAIETSLQNFCNGNGDGGDHGDGGDEPFDSFDPLEHIGNGRDDESGEDGAQMRGDVGRNGHDNGPRSDDVGLSGKGVGAIPRKREKKKKVVDSWEDDSDEDEEDSSDPGDDRDWSSMPDAENRSGLRSVLFAFRMLREAFEVKFRKGFA